MPVSYSLHCVFFFTATPPTDIYTLSLHDALPICFCRTFGEGVSANGAIGRRRGLTAEPVSGGEGQRARRSGDPPAALLDRKSTRLNSSHLGISYAVFCLKKKNRHHTGLEIHESDV